jgi:hypothetical protein
MILWIVQGKGTGVGGRLETTGLLGVHGGAAIEVTAQAFRFEPIISIETHFCIVPYTTLALGQRISPRCRNLTTGRSNAGWFGQVPECGLVPVASLAGCYKTCQFVFA